jgi:hypothetical protein
LGGSANIPNRSSNSSPNPQSREKSQKTGNVSNTRNTQSSSSLKKSLTEAAALPDDPLSSWVQQSFSQMLGPAYDTALTTFFLPLTNPKEIREYVSAHIGTSREANTFVREYLNRKESGGKASDGKGVRETTDSNKNTVTGGKGRGGKKKKRNKMVDPSLLNFRSNLNNFNIVTDPDAD